MSLASYKTVLESVTSHEQSAAESSIVMVHDKPLTQRITSCYTHKMAIVSYRIVSYQTL